MIDLLADENFPLDSVDLLQETGFNVLSVSRNYKGISDYKIIELANLERRLILTFDRDFGQLIFKEGFIPSEGVVYFRLENFTPVRPAQIVIKLLGEDVFATKGFMTVVDENFIRQKKF